MAEEIIQIAEDFWNIRGSFRIGGVVDIGTQASLVRLANGSFVLLDSYAISEALVKEIDAILGRWRDRSHPQPAPLPHGTRGADARIVP